MASYDPYRPLVAPPGVPPEQLDDIQPDIAPPPQTQRVMRPPAPPVSGSLESVLGEQIASYYKPVEMPPLDTSFYGSVPAPSAPPPPPPMEEPPVTSATPIEARQTPVQPSTQKPALVHLLLR